MGEYCSCTADAVEKDQHATRRSHPKQTQRRPCGLAIPLVRQGARRTADLSKESDRNGRRVCECRSSSSCGEGRACETQIYALRSEPSAMTMAELCLHFEQHELTRDDHWRSYSTRRNYSFYLRRWIISRWGRHELGEIRTAEVESWPRNLPRAGCHAV